MLKTLKENKTERAMALLPENLRSEIMRLCACRSGGLSALSEVRLRAGGVCSALIGGECVVLYSSLGDSEMADLVVRLTGNALYAHRDSISSGYLTLDGGIRVGLCGLAKYDGQGMVGVSEMGSLVFRFPRGECAFENELFAVWREGVGTGMLIYSPPGVGKTTALRSLAGKIGRGNTARRVCVVDERCEFCKEDYRLAQVDILRGYKRCDGLDIAVRTMSCEVVMIDELGADDASRIVNAVRCGIPLVATAHASSFDEIRNKASLRPLMDCRAFEVFVGIRREGSRYSLSVDRPWDPI